MNITSTNTETLLIENCINGNRKSQKELYDMFSGKMFYICVRYAKNQMDAEDILQDGFVKLFNNLNKFRGEGSFEGWVKRIFITTCLGYLKLKKLDIKELEEFENKIIDTYKNVFDDLSRKDIIKSSFELSLGYRTVFHLYALEGYSHKEIASRLGITESTSKSQLSRAKAILTHKIKHIPLTRRS